MSFLTSSLDDKRVHLIEEGYDLVIRIGALEDSGLVAKRLCDFPSRICASKDFIKQHGKPSSPRWPTKAAVCSVHEQPTWKHFEL